MTTFEKVKDVAKEAPDLYAGVLVAVGDSEYIFGFDIQEADLMWLDRHGIQHSPDQPVWKLAQDFLKRYFSDAGILVTSEGVDSYDFEAVEKTAEGQGLKVLDIYKDGRQRNTRVQKMIGLANTTGPVAYWSGHHSKSLAFLESVGKHRGAKQVNEDIVELRKIDSRAAVVIVEGPYNFLASYKQVLSEPDYVVFVGTADSLKRLDIKVVDDGPLGSLDDHLFGKRPAAPRKPRTTQAKAKAQTGTNITQVAAQRRSRPMDRPKTVTRSASDAMGVPTVMGGVPGGNPVPSDPAEDQRLAALAKSFLDGNVDIPEYAETAPPPDIYEEFDQIGLEHEAELQRELEASEG